MSNTRISRRTALAAAVGIATSGVALGRVGGDGLSVEVSNEGAPAVVDLSVVRRATEEETATATVEVAARGRERTSLPVPAGTYTVAVTVDGDPVGAVDLHLGRTPTGRLSGPGVGVHLAADGSHALTLS